MRLNIGVRIETIELSDELAQKVWDEFAGNVKEAILVCFIASVKNAIGEEKAYNAVGRTQVTIN